MLGIFVKTETSSFRLEKEVFEEFKKHAKKHGLTVNSLINKIMKEYVEFTALAPATQVIPYPSPVIVKLLKNSSEKQIREIAQGYVKEHFVENLLLLKNEVSVDAFLEVAQNWCTASGFPYSIREKNGITNFTVRHNNGNRFSILLGEVIKCQIEELIKKPAEVKETPNSVSFWV